MKKTYVLDTNVLLYSPGAIFTFDNSNIVIPEVVLEELDNFKKVNSDLGMNARNVARILDKLRLKGKLSQGVDLDNNSNLRVVSAFYNTKIPESWNIEKADNRIIQVCKALIEQGEDVCLITKDIFERIKADTVDIQTKDYYEEEVPTMEDQYMGRRDVYASSLDIDMFFKNKSIEVDVLTEYNKKLGTYNKPDLVINEFLIIHANNNERQTALGRYDGKRVVPLLYKNNTKIMGISPRNVGQKFMLECLSIDADKAPLVIIKGPAGTAKTLFSLAVGLKKILDSEDKEYRRILVCRPNVTMDEDIGHLPGTEQDKIAPFMRPIFDNLEILIAANDGGKYSNEKELNDKIEELFEKKIITTEAVGFLRGRSIVKNWIVIDEAQNLTPKQVKAIVTRAGEGSKIILIGDPEQIDQAFLDLRSNGLCYASEKMKGSPLCYQVSLLYDECERSKLAFEGAKRL